MVLPYFQMKPHTRKVGFFKPPRRCTVVVFFLLCVGYCSKFYNFFLIFWSRDFGCSFSTATRPSAKAGSCAINSRAGLTILAQKQATMITKIVYWLTTMLSLSGRPMQRQQHSQRLESVPHICAGSPPRSGTCSTQRMQRRCKA